MDNRYEVLKGLPTYGDIAIPIIDEDDIFVSEGYVVKFYKNDGSTWIANFPKGESNLSFVKEISKNNYILVISGGDGYLMNPNHHKPVKKLQYFAEEMIERDDGRLILVSITDIMFLDENAAIEWEKNIGLDGIKDLKLDDNKLIGYCYNIFIDYEKNNDLWVKFTIDLDTKEVEGGCYNFPEVVVKIPWFKYFITTVIIGHLIYVFSMIS